MHNKTYILNIACCSSENFIKSIEEIKSFFSFKFFFINHNEKNIEKKDFDAIIIESDFGNKIPLNKIKAPKILIKKRDKKNLSNNIFEQVLSFPIKAARLNQAIIDLCKKNEFKINSEIKIKSYILDKNERVLKKGHLTLKITEKEIHFIETLNQSKKPLVKDFILKNIWKYSTGVDTHTIETHIYRLRQKIKESFNDNDFIKNNKNGYFI